MLHFSNHDEVVTDACVLLCGSVGELILLDLGYTGPLVKRPLLAARERTPRHGDPVPAGADDARSETERMQRT